MAKSRQTRAIRATSPRRTARRPSQTPGSTGRRRTVRMVKATKKNLGWPEDKTFYVPEEAARNWAEAKTRGAKAHAEWDADFAEYKKAYPEEAEQASRLQHELEKRER